MAKQKKKKINPPAGGKKKKLKKKILRQAQDRRPAKIRKILHKKKKKVVVKGFTPKKKVKRKVIAKKKKAVKKAVIKKPVARIKAKPTVKHKNPSVPASTFAAETLFKAKIKVVGIGGGGGSIVSEIGRSLEKATFVIADTDIRALKKKSGIKYFWFGEELTHGLGTGVNVDLAKQAAESVKDKIGGFFKDQDIIIFVASLGGGVGSGATQVFAEVAKEFGGITLGIFTMPFKFEGKNKQRTAQNALKILRQSLNVSLVIPNEKIFKVIDASTPITNAFSTVNKSLIESLESLIDLIYSPGIINIDFADLRTILKGRGNSAFLNTIEESGKDRVEKTCERIFKNPLLQTNNFQAEKILFNIAGSENLSMFEVEKISSHIDSFHPKAKIIFGISKDTKLKNRIKTTILMTGGQTDLEEEKAETPFAKPSVVPIIKEKIISKKPAVKKEKKPAVILKKHKVTEKKKKLEVPKKDKPVSIPVFKVPVFAGLGLDENIQVLKTSELNKKTIRRSGLEIKEAEELQERKKIAQEKEWEIPAFLRKVKFKS